MASALRGFSASGRNGVESRMAGFCAASTEADAHPPPFPTSHGADTVAARLFPIVVSGLRGRLGSRVREKACAPCPSTCTDCL